MTPREHMHVYDTDGEFETHLATLGITNPMVQWSPDQTLRPDILAPLRDLEQTLHTLPTGRGHEAWVAPQNGEQLTILKTLGEGGMGVVHLATQNALAREVAVKTLREPFRGDDASTEALLQEAYVMGFLEHPNIIPVYAMSRSHDGAPLIVMKRVEGTSWFDLLMHRHLRGFSFELVDHIAILIQVANAVRFAHSRRIIHRDIKPENIMIGDFDEVYLLDWGIAVSLDENQTILPQQSAAQGVFGTPHYMAPEMTTGSDWLDERTDVYLLGATLHEILVGSPRHHGQSLLQVLYAAHHCVPVDYPSHVPAELAAIANRACHRDPEQRFQTAEAFRDALSEFLEHRESIVLAETANLRRRELEVLLGAPEPDVLAVHDTFGECRFGFVQALRMWSDNDEARQGLQRCLEAMLQYYVTTANLPAAQACLAELPEPPAALTDQVESLRQRLAAANAEFAELRAMAREQDMGMNSTARAVLVFFLGIIWTGFALYSAIRFGSGNITIEEQLQSHMTGGIRNLVVALIAVVALRQKVFVNAINRQIIYIMITGMSVVALLRLGVWVLGEGLAVGRIADFAVYSMMFLVTGLITSTRIKWLALPYVLAIPASLVWLEGQLYITAVATLITSSWLAWLWRPQPRRESAS